MPCSGDLLNADKQHGGYPEFDHSRSRPLKDQTKVDHSKSGRVRILGPHNISGLRTRVDNRIKQQKNELLKSYCGVHYLPKLRPLQQF